MNHKKYFKKLEPVIEDFLNAFDQLENVRKGITCFASSKITNGKDYDLATTISKNLSQEGYSIITGGGPGIMEACNKGAKEGKGKSIGLTMDIVGQENNKYLDIEVKFKYFFSRKVTFARYANAFIVFPGGFGTLDELFEVLTLVQTQHIQRRPVIMIGTKYWDKLEGFIYDTLVTSGAVLKEDLKLFKITDDGKEVIKIIDKFMEEKDRLKRKKFI